MALSYEIITSRQNNLLVETHKLTDRKHRNRSGNFRFDGVKLTAEALLRDVKLIAVSDKEAFAALAEKAKAAL